MTSEPVTYEAFRAEMGALAVREHSAPPGIGSFMWSPLEPFVPIIQRPLEVLMLDRTVQWRGHVVRLAWSRHDPLVFYYFEREEPGDPPPVVITGGPPRAAVRWPP